MQLAALKTPRKHALARRTKFSDKNYLKHFILGLKIFILGQNFLSITKFSENFYPRTKFSENFYPRTKFSENFYPRMKIFRKLSEIFCPMWGRTNFIWVGQKFSEKFVLGKKLSHRTKNF